ncbi:MAG: signal peptidase I [Planctomycetes bacterium]|nr:signal peptidase I [Planctomycetota bacterium]
MTAPDDRAPPRRRGRRWPTALAGALALAIALTLAAARWVLVPYRVIGCSMLPTLAGSGGGAAGDIVLVNRLAYALRDPGRWDVVVLERPGSAGEDAPRENVKRVAGLPGERLEILDGRVVIDGVPLDPPEALRGAGVVRKERYGHEPLRLGPDEYFVLGDSSYLSTDSRRWGPVRRGQIQGRVELVVLPWRRSGRVR